MQKTERKSESFSHSFLAVFPSLVMQRISSNAYEFLVSFNPVPYMQISGMIPGVNIIGGKVSLARVKGTGRIWGYSETPMGVLGAEHPKIIFRF